MIRSRRNHGAPRRSGFTLVEVAIVVVLLSIMAAVVVPALRSPGGQSLESAARILATDLRLARELAMSSGSDWSVQLNVANNSYEVVHTGSGSPPPLRNPLAAPGSEEGPYVVEFNKLGTTGPRLHAVSLGGAALKDSRTAVTDITFGPLGGTGPARSEDTIVWLTEGTDPDERYVRLRVSWITGQVWLDPIAVLDSSDPDQLFQ